MTKNVAVIILNWNGEKLLREFLGSVVENTNPDIADVVVADNGSTDGSLAYVAMTFPQVKIIRFAENYGYAEGDNRAIAITAIVCCSTPMCRLFPAGLSRSTIILRSISRWQPASRN